MSSYEEKLAEEKRKLRAVLREMSDPVPGNVSGAPYTGPPQTSRIERRLAKKFFRKHGVK